MIAVALAAIAGIVGVVGFVAARGEEPPATTTTTTTVDPRPEYIAAMAQALTEHPELPLGPDHATCVATALFDGLGPDRLEALVGRPDPLGSLPPQQRELVLRALVSCVPPEVAEALLAGSTTTKPIAGLPDEGG
jgi:hypothetical protein